MNAKNCRLYDSLRIRYSYSSNCGAAQSWKAVERVSGSNLAIHESVTWLHGNASAYALLRISLYKYKTR